MKLANISINNLRRRKSKMLFLIAGMAIGIATIVSLYSITSAMKTEIGNKFDEIGANMTVVPKSSDLALSYAGVSVDDLNYDVKELDMSAINKIKTIKNKNNIATIAPKLLGTTQVENKDRVIIGVDFNSELRMKKWWKYQGEKPKDLHDVILGQTVANDLAKKPGDTIKIGGETHRVSAVLNGMGSEEDNIIMMDISLVQKILGKPNAVSFFEVSALCNTCPIAEITRQISDKLPDSEVKAIKEVVEARKLIVDRFANLALAVSLIVLAIGSMIILTTMMSSINERTREIGIFRAIGFRRGHVIKIILLEAAIISIIGGALGYLTGMLTAKFIGPVIAQMDVKIIWDYKVALAAFGIAMVIGLLASAFPAVKASRLDPVEALRFM